MAELYPALSGDILGLGRAAKRALTPDRIPHGGLRSPNARPLAVRRASVLSRENAQVGGALIRRLQGLGTIIPADRATLDLAQPDRIAQALEQLAPEIILNPAAYTAVEKAEDEPNVAMVANGTAPGVIGRWAAKNDVPLIHFSADYVFNGAGERPWREDDATGPLNTKPLSG